MRALLATLGALLCCQSPVVLAEETGAAPDPWAGCWARVYDAAHLAKHKGQLVTAMTVAIDFRPVSGGADAGTHDARVAVTLRGKDDTYTTTDPARCAAHGPAGSQLSCVFGGFFLGTFQLEQSGKNLKLVMREGDGVTVVPGVDHGALVRLAPDNPEHAVFLLNRMPPSACGD